MEHILKENYQYKPHTFFQWRKHPAVLLILETGPRISEALNLRTDAAPMHLGVSASPP